MDKDQQEHKHTVGSGSTDPVVLCKQASQCWVEQTELLCREAAQEDAHFPSCRSLLENAAPSPQFPYSTPSILISGHMQTFSYTEFARESHVLLPVATGYF